MMSDKASNIPRVAFSVRAYQLLLKAYPAKFRQEYGSHMAQVFQDCCLRAVHQGEANGMARLWAITLLDFRRSVLEQHLQKETVMSKSKFIKLSGWALIVGSFVLLLSFLSGSASGFLMASILMALGLLGLRTRYGDSVGSLGKNVLLAGVVGMVLAYAAVPIFRGVDVFRLLLWDVEAMYLLPFSGPAVLLTGLAVFGLVALRRKPLPQANWLPLIAGIGYPAIFFPVFFYTIMNNGAWPEWDNFPFTSFMIIMLVQLIALTMLGAILQDGVAGEAVPA